MAELAPKVFLESVKEDPLFAAEGMDVERAETAIGGIEKNASQFEKILSKRSFLRRLFFIAMPVARSAIPVPFLRRFVESEKSRRLFLNNPTLEAGLNLIWSWEETQKELALGLKNFEKLYRILAALDRTGEALLPVQDMFGNVIKIGDMDLQISKMKRNALALAGEINEKRKYLYGLKTGISNKERIKVPEPRYVPGKISDKYARMHELSVTHGLPFRHGTILEQFGPISYELTQFDGIPVRHNFMLYIVRNNKSGIVSFKVNSLDTFTFMKIGAGAKDSGLHPHHHMSGTGLPYWYQPSTNFYTTRDSGYWADLSAIVDMERRPGLNRRLILAQKSSMLDLILNACLEEYNSFLFNVRDHAEFGTYTPRLRWYWLLMRTYPNIFYLSFNKSVWRIPEKEIFSGSGRAKPEDTVYKRADEILREITKEELELAMQGGRIREEKRKAIYLVST